MDGAPGGAIEEVEADDAVGIDVRVPWDWVCVILDKNDFGRLNKSA